MTLRSTNAAQTLVRVEEPVLIRSTASTACAHPALTVSSVCLGLTTVPPSLACMGNALNSSKGKLNRLLLSDHFTNTQIQVKTFLIDFYFIVVLSFMLCSILTAVVIAHFPLMCTFMWCEGTFVSVTLAGGVNCVSRRRMSACLTHVRTVAAAWTAITATPACVSSDSKVVRNNC